MYPVEVFSPASVIHAELEPGRLEMEVKARTIKLQSEFKLYQTSYRLFLLKHPQHVSFCSFTESDTSTPCTEYAKLSKNVQELKKNVSSLQEGSVSRGLY